ncbi:MAG: SBBP repeat-containing protein [Ignavibacteria bacterium]|nr:SBBP repeat-containing protein [Ignavibacteria bacterium]
MGSFQWERRYNGSGNSDDIITSIKIDGSGNIYATGGSIGLGSNIDYLTIKYNSAGVQQWVQRYNGIGNGIDWANAIYVDGSGNVYVTGSSTNNVFGSRDYSTLKYNSTGVLQWKKDLMAFYRQG